MSKVVLQMRAAVTKEAAPRRTVSPGSRMGDFGQDAGGMVGPDDDYEDEWSPPPAADNENDADAGAVAGLASDFRSIQQELDKLSQACRERGEATANDEASEVNGASQLPRLRESDLVSICEAFVASAKIVYRMERFRQSIGRCYLEFLWVLLQGVLGVFSV